MDHKVWVYKVDYSIQSSLLSSLVLISIQGSFSWSTLRSWVCNILSSLVLTLIQGFSYWPTIRSLNCNKWALIQDKWLDFSYLASIFLKPRVWLFFLTKIVLLLVKDNKRVRKKEILYRVYTRELNRVLSTDCISVNI